jgi:hypothetical protein
VKHTGGKRQQRDNGGCFGAAQQVNRVCRDFAIRYVRSPVSRSWTGLPAPSSGAMEQQIRLPSNLPSNMDTTTHRVRGSAVVPEFTANTVRRGGDTRSSARLLSLVERTGWSENRLVSARFCRRRFGESREYDNSLARTPYQIATDTKGASAPQQRIVCPHCGSRRTFRARDLWIWDHLLLPAIGPPYRCEACLKKFHSWRTRI